MRPLFVLCFAVACGTPAPDGDCSHAFYADEDGDRHGATVSTASGCVAPPGFETTNDDCDDGDATIHPNVPERCNEIDDDCDGSIDVDGVDGDTWYADLDGDGHGDPLATTTACSIPLGYAAAGDDCDDTDAAIHGGAAEVCNDLDDDCDGTTDVDAIDAPIWYADEDGDGYGDPTSITARCSLPPEYSPTNDDCDDDDAAVHPGAVEVCNEIDDDCEGTTDVDAADMPTWYVDADGDGHGDPGASIIACAGPLEYPTTSSDDCNDSDASIYAGADELCNEIDDDCDALIDVDDPSVVDAAWYDDADGDGYGDPTGTASIGCEAPAGMVQDDTDCDDSSAEVNPGVKEMCNEIDDDCDALIDDDDTSAVGREIWYPDGDGDGVGGLGAAYQLCVGPTGYVTTFGDCDDTDATVAVETTAWWDGDGDGYGGREDGVCGELSGPWILTPGDCDDARASIFPGAVEVCNDRDDNCDDLTDEADPLVVWATFYADADGDGYGDDAVTVAESCDAPSGYVALGGDCAEGDPAVYPTAPEYCDEKDNDCNGSTDDAVVYADYYADADGDGFGVADDTVNECVPPAGYSLTPGDCNDDRAHTFPGATEICANGADDDCDGYRDNCSLTTDDADLLIVGPSGVDAYVGAWVGAADLDADGAADVIAAAGWDDGFYVVFGPRSGELSTDDADLATDPSVASNRPVAAGDADGDGDDDLLLLGEYERAAYLLLGPMTAGSDVSTADATFEQSVGTSGTARIVPDHDGDGSPDVVVSAVDYGGSRQRGAVYVAPGESTGTIDLDMDATYVYNGGPLTRRDELGASIAALGDTTGDGIEDLAVGAPGGDARAVWLVEGGAPPGTYTLTDATSLASLTRAGPVGFGSALGASDYDGDGYGDLFVGASAGSPTLYGFSGPFAEALDTDDADVCWIGDRNLGRRIAADGDVDGDGAPDLLLDGTVVVYLQVGEARGVVDVAGLPTFHSEDDNSLAFSFVPDWTGDGGSEVVLGEPYSTGDGLHPGRVAVISSENLY